MSSPRFTERQLSISFHLGYTIIILGWLTAAAILSNLRPCTLLLRLSEFSDTLSPDAQSANRQ